MADPVLCKSRTCPLSPACARHAASGTATTARSLFAQSPAALWDEAETAACSGWILAKDTE